MASADRLIELFHEAKTRRVGVERHRFLLEACSGELALKDELLSLLRAEEEVGGFLQEASAVPIAEQPGATIGHYKLLEQIGEGGCGVVWLAEQTEPVRRRVALKVIKLGMDTRAVVARFEAERQALALMDHPHIAKVLEAGATATGRPFFVMELVRGAKITQFCEQEQLTTGDRLRLFIQVCQAVQHAHQKGVIHRDLKPSNVLVTMHDGAPVPKVIDFGIAKATSDQRLTDHTVFTAAEQFLGTPAYMSPEQAEMGGLDIDTRSDIYSLGVLLYELLTGATPFETQELTQAGVDEMRRIIREREPLRPSMRLARQFKPEDRRPRNRPAEIHHDLDWIVMKCLEKDRTRRYATANALGADLERYLNNEPVLARPPSTSYRILKAFRRHKLAFASLSAVLLSLVMGLWVSVWQNIKASRAEREAQHQAYIAKMNLARQAWEDNSIGGLRRLLKETEAYRDRGFEWYYWQRQAHLELRTLRGHFAPVVDVSFSPDGGRVLTASLDGTARLWDATQGTELRRLTAQRGAVASASWSPSGQSIITANADGTASIWDAATGKLQMHLEGHTNSVTSVRFSPDGQYIVTGSVDKTARVWRAATGEQISRLTHFDMVWSVAFSPDGKQILTGSADEKATLWDAFTGAVLQTNEPASARIAARNISAPVMFYAGFSPDGRSIVTVSQNMIANLWDSRTGARRLELRGNPHWLSPRQSDVPLTANFSPGGEQLIVGGLDFSARVWRLADATNLFTLKGHEAEITSAVFSPNGRLIVTGSYDHTARIWSAAGPSDALSLGLHTNVVSGAAFSPDGRWIATASWDGKSMVWDADTGLRQLTLDHGPIHVWSVGFSPNGARIVTGASDGNFRTWDAFAGRELLKVKGHDREIETAAFSRDGQRILTAAADSTAALWDAATGKQLLRLNHNQRYVRAAFSPDGRRIATGCNDNDRNTLEDATAAVWEARTGRKLFALEGHRNGFSALAFSPDGRYIVTGSVDWTATVWDASNGKKGPVLKGHHGQVIAVAVSPDSSRIFTGGFDNTTRVWDAVTGQELLTVRGGVFTVPGISPHGRRIIAGPEPPILVWQVASPDQVARWRDEERLAGERIETEGRMAHSGGNPR